jgi:pimeloyl-ACP methyl ester carboxylesterase
MGLMDFYGRDGLRLAYQEAGHGRPLVLIHGHQDRGAHWVDSGLAGRLAGRGYRVIMPDLRAHGDSAKPHDATSYPPDVLTDDGLALIDHLGIADYDLAGHSLGGRTVIRMLARGATPRRAVISGYGLDALLHAAENTGWYRQFFSACGTGVFEPGSDEQETEDWLLANGGDPEALLLALDSWVNTAPEELAAITVPVLILTGTQDRHNRTAKALADALHGRRVEVPGDHFTAEKSPEFYRALTEFLLAPAITAAEGGRLRSQAGSQLGNDLRR